MFDVILKKDLVCVCLFENGVLHLAIMDLKGKIYKKFKCEDETVINYFLEVFNL